MALLLVISRRSPVDLPLDLPYISRPDRAGIHGAPRRGDSEGDLPYTSPVSPLYLPYRALLDAEIAKGP